MKKLHALEMFLLKMRVTEYKPVRGDVYLGTLARKKIIDWK